jgi:hypothetical protein
MIMIATLDAQKFIASCRLSTCDMGEPKQSLQELRQTEQGSDAQPWSSTLSILAVRETHRVANQALLHG